ncbi:MAG: hypothetical protein IPK73_23175 [Candidatus Obscuribacter sp.]|nr:hypothetical protein [Candidatus Obscuribacter sp.]MBK9277017.1 hypothetical protein [Candidatus Obscuribacter sp.]
MEQRQANLSDAAGAFLHLRAVCRNSLVLPLSLSLSLTMLFVSAAAATSPVEKPTGKPSPSESGSVALSQAACDKELSVLENRFFFHQYGHDPLEKRLERLELLILGESRAGGESQRLAALKKAVQERDSQAAKVMKERAASPEVKAGGESYPVVTGLEWKVLQKTYPKESLDQRLNRLEEHLFGVPSQAMSYVDRIERLRKTTGFGVSVAPSDGGINPGRQTVPRNFKFGPLPKSPGNNEAFPEGDDSAPGEPPQFRTFQDKFGNGGFYFSNKRTLPMPSLTPGGQPRPLAEMFDEMNRQMMDMMRNFNGVEEMPFPISPDGTVIPFGTLKKPGGAAPSAPLPVPIPGGRSPLRVPAPEEKLPPYSDPNSI